MIRPRRHVTPDPRLELTPLMDVMFLLLTFFIFAFVLMVRLDVSDIRLPPTAAGEGVERRERIVLALTSDGALTLDSKPTSLATLAADLRARLETDPGAELVIAADVESRSGVLFELMDVLRAAGYQDLRFLRLPASGAAQAPAATPGP